MREGRFGVSAPVRAVSVQRVPASQGRSKNAVGWRARVEGGRWLRKPGSRYASRLLSRPLRSAGTLCTLTARPTAALRIRTGTHAQRQSILRES